MNNSIKQARPSQIDAVAAAAALGSVGAAAGGWLGCKACGAVAALGAPLHYADIPPMTALQAAWRIISTHQTPPDWLYWPGIGALSLGVIGAITGLNAAWRSGERHLRGPRLVAAQNLPRARGTPGLELSPRIRLSQEEETWNILAIGSAGSGKTTILRPLTEAAIERGDRVLVFDFKRDFTQLLLGKPNTHLLAPWDCRSARWRIGEDVASIPAARQFINALIPESKDAPIWGRGARTILGTLVQTLMAEYPGEWCGGDLIASASALLSDHEALRGVLAEHAPEALSIVDTAPQTRASFLMNIGAALTPIGDLAAAESLLPEDRTWSVKCWLRTPGSVAILGWLPTAQDMSRAYALPIIEQCIVGLLSLSDCAASDPARRTWLILDEIAQAGFVPSLTSGITTLRSKGGRLALGLQSIGQLRTYYGLDAAEVWVGQATTRIISRLNNVDDAKHAAALLGDRTVERYAPQAGAPGESWKRLDESVATAHDLRQLGPKRLGVEALVITRGGIGLETWPYLKPPVNATAAIVESNFLKPHFRKPSAAKLGRIIDLERLRRNAPPPPDWARSEMVER